MFEIYLMGNGLFFSEIGKKNSIKCITNQMQMNKMNVHLPVQQWQRRFAGVRYIWICYWLTWHTMWLMQVLHYKPRWSVPLEHGFERLLLFLVRPFWLLSACTLLFFFPKQMMGTNVAAPEQKDWKIWTLFLAQSYNVLLPRPCWFLSVHLFVFLFQVRLKPMVFLEVT